MAGITQRRILPVAEEKRAEPLALARAARVAADHELRGLERFELEPRFRALAGLVETVEPLGDDSLEALLERGVIELLGIARRVHQLQMWRRREALRQVAVAITVGCATQVEPGDMQQVEAHQHRRGRALCGR